MGSWVCGRAGSEHQTWLFGARSAKGWEKTSHFREIDQKRRFWPPGFRAGNTDQGSRGHVPLEREARRRNATLALHAHPGAGHEEVWSNLPGAWSNFSAFLRAYFMPLGVLWHLRKTHWEGNGGLRNADKGGRRGQNSAGTFQRSLNFYNQAD